MSAALHLARPDDAAQLLPMIEAFHDEAEVNTTAEHRSAALNPLLEGTPLGCAYLIGPRNAPIGYIVVSFGWSIEFGGLVGVIDEFFIRKGVRGRGVGSEVLTVLLPKLEAAGVAALHLQVEGRNSRLQRLYARAGFNLREGFGRMSRVARPNG
ncbi:MAG: GNAT family N-acetyltransferase [Pseudomonadota bacterium]